MEPYLGNATGFTEGHDFKAHSKTLILGGAALLALRSMPHHHCGL
jgi:hypothetical protein